MRRVKLLALDLLFVALATMSAVWLRDNLNTSWNSFAATLPYLGISLACALVILPAMGIDRTMWRFSGLSDYKRLAISCAIIVMTSVLISFATVRLENVYRALPLLQGILMVVLMVGARILMRTQRSRRAKAEASLTQTPEQKSVIVLGLSAVSELFIQAVAENPDAKIAIAGVIGRNDRHTGHLFRGQPILGTPEDLPQILKNLDVHGVEIDRIVVAVGFDKLSETARQAILDIENGTQISVDYFAERLGFVERQKPEEQTSTVTALKRAQRFANDQRELLQSLNRPYWRAKRLFDITFSAITILAVMPIMVLIGMLNAIVHGLPILFWQQRPGLHGQAFRVYKFRSLLGAHDEMGQRLPDELRETAFGHFLRATRLDELPQLINIFLGHMSFVGPRPLLMSDQLDQFRNRLLVRPGLTGWAQVNGGKSLSASDKMALDIWYIRNATFKLDVKIALKTIAMVAFGERENQEAVDQAWIEIRRNQGKIVHIDRVA